MTVICSALPPPPQPGVLARLKASGPHSLAIQVIVLLALAGSIAFVVGNVVGNVARLNLNVGFAFLSRPAGFEIAQSLIDYPHNATYFRAFLAAFLNTALMAVVSIVFATVLGFLVSMARLGSNPLLSLLAQFYIETVRNVPLLLQLFFWYFAVLGHLPAPRQSLSAYGMFFLNNRGLFFPSPVAQASFPAFAAIASVLIGAAIIAFILARRFRIRTGLTSRIRWSVGLGCLAVPVVMFIASDPLGWSIPKLSGFNIGGGVSVIPEFVALAIGMSIYGSAFIAELIRGGVETVGRGQTEAGLSLGLSRWRVYSKIVIPQALRAIVPPLTGQYITLLKNTSLASAIGYPDLMLIFAGTALNQTGQPLEIMGITMASYLLLCLATATIGNIVNRRMQLVER
jgi:general L-amino acid transport system permease protein